MKKLSGIAFLALSFVSSPAFADWSHPVSYMEVIFGCFGEKPELSKVRAADLSIKPFGNGGEVRLQDAKNAEDTLLNLDGNKIFFRADPASTPVQVGILNQANTPKCTLDDTGEDAHPSWNAVTFLPGVSVELSLKTDPATCEFDPENDDFIRTLHYTFTVAEPSAKTASVKWDEVGRYASPQACQTLE